MMIIIITNNNNEDEGDLTNFDVALESNNDD